MKFYFALLSCLGLRIKKHPRWPKSQWILGHRGARQVAPENTLSSFKIAMEQGADGVEFDVIPSRDQVLMVIHDDTLQRTTNGTGLVWQHDYQDLARLDASKLKPDFSPERLPTMLEALSAMPDGSIVNIELKNNGDLGKEQFVKLALKDIKNHEKRLNIIVSSFDADLLVLLRNQNVSFPISLLLSKRDSHYNNSLRLIKNIKPDALHLSPDLATLQARMLIRMAHMGLALWTINDPKKAKQWFSCGVNGIFTDNVKEIIKAKLAL